MFQGVSEFDFCAGAGFTYRFEHSLAINWFFMTPKKEREKTHEKL
jgi:hypothetical protein